MLIILGNLVLELSILLVLVILLRVFYLMHKITTGHTKVNDGARNRPAKMLVCVGSGGHTTEILSLVGSLDLDKYSPRYYVLANTDNVSTFKVHNLENSKSSELEPKDYHILEIPRSRIVHQSYFTSIFTTLYSLIHCVPLMIRIRPDLILCNGPGTCVPVCIIAFLLKAAFICDTRIVFIESFCRTKTFSLTGKILIYFADNVLVQWPSLKQKLKRADYIGQLL